MGELNLLRGASGLQKTQLDAMRKRYNEITQVSKTGSGSRSKM